MPSLKRLGTSYFKKLESAELSANLCPPGSRLAAAIYSLLPAGASLPSRPTRDSGEQVCIPRQRLAGATDASTRRPRAQRPDHPCSRSWRPGPPLQPSMTRAWGACGPPPGPTPPRICRAAGAWARSARGAQWGAGVAGGCARARWAQVPCYPGEHRARGTRGRGLREAGCGGDGEARPAEWEVARAWRAEGSQLGARQVRRVPRRWGWRPQRRGRTLERGARGKGRRTSEVGASFSEQAEPRWARSDGAAAAVRGKMD